MFLDFRERKEGGAGGQRNMDVRERHQSVASRTCPDQGSNCNLGMCLDLESTFLDVFGCGRCFLGEREG